MIALEYNPMDRWIESNGVAWKGCGLTRDLQEWHNNVSDIFMHMLVTESPSVKDQSLFIDNGTIVFEWTDGSIIEYRKVMGYATMIDLEG